MAEVEGGVLLDTCNALIACGRWESADRLIDSVQTGDRAERAMLAVVKARIAVELRQWRGAGDPTPELDAATTTVSAIDSPASVELALCRLFNDYWTVLQPRAGGAVAFGPDGRDQAFLDQLRDRAADLMALATDQRQRARAAFYAGLIADNLRGEHAAAEEFFHQALTACRPGDDDDLAAEALRHLGGQAFDAGDLGTATDQWRRSAHLAQQAGRLPLVLAQQALLAEATARAGDPAAASVLAGEVRRWAGTLGLHRLEAQAAALESTAD